jgi:hypothetical protein
LIKKYGAEKLKELTQTVQMANSQRSVMKTEENLQNAADKAPEHVRHGSKMSDRSQKTHKSIITNASELPITLLT